MGAKADTRLLGLRQWRSIFMVDVSAMIIDSGLLLMIKSTALASCAHQRRSLELLGRAVDSISSRPPPGLSLSEEQRRETPDQGQIYPGRVPVDRLL